MMHLAKYGSKLSRLYTFYHDIYEGYLGPDEVSASCGK